MAQEMIRSLERLAELLEARSPLFRALVVRPGRRPVQPHSKAGLMGAELPGLSANPLAVEAWWGARSAILWVARRLHDYSHLEKARAPGARVETSRGHWLA